MWIGGALAGLEVIAGEEEVFALGVLPVVPDGFAVEAPELVAGDLHDHGAFVDEGVVGAVGVDHPDAVDLLPGAFVAVHEEFGVGRGEEEVVDPVGGVKEGLHVAGFLAVGAGLEADGEEDERKTGGEAALHHLALVFRLVVRALGGAGYAVVWGWSAGGGGHVGAVLLAGGVAFDVGSGGEGLVGVDADDADLRGKVDELADRRRC